MNNKVVKMNAQQLADYIIKLGFGKTINFYEECNEETGFFTFNCSACYGITTMETPFDSYIILADYWGGGKCSVEGGDCYRNNKEEEFSTDEQGYINSFIENYLEHYVYCSEVYVEIEKEV